MIYFSGFRYTCCREAVTGTENEWLSTVVAWKMGTERAEAAFWGKGHTLSRFTIWWFVYFIMSRD